jgi:hypothetical protein
MAAKNAIPAAFLPIPLVMKQKTDSHHDKR